MATLVTAEETATQVEVASHSPRPKPVARRRGPPSPTSPPRRRRRRGADPVGHRQRPPDASAPPESSSPCDRGPLRPARTPGPSIETLFGHIKTEWPHEKITDPNTLRAELDIARTTTPAACTPPWATSPPTTNTDEDPPGPPRRPARSPAGQPAMNTPAHGDGSEAPRLRQTRRIAHPPRPHQPDLRTPPRQTRPAPHPPPRPAPHPRHDPAATRHQPQSRQRTPRPRQRLIHHGRLPTRPPWHASPSSRHLRNRHLRR